MSGIKEVLLGDVASLQAGVGFPLNLQGRSTGDYPLAKVGDISRGGRSGQSVLSSADHYIDKVDLERLGAKPIPQGSILFAKIGEAISHNHRVIAGCDLLVDNNAMAAIPGPNVLSRYLYHFLRTVDFYRLASATTVPVLRKTELEKISIPLPPILEQRRIAAILDKADELRAKRRSALAQLDAINEAVFVELFDNAKSPEHEIGDLLNSGSLLLHKDGNYGSMYPRADDFGDVGVPFLTAKAITDDGLIDVAAVERLRDEKAARLKFGWISTGDVLLAHNASVGKVALYDGRFETALIGTSLTAFRPNPDALDSRYLAAALRSRKFQQQLEKNMGQTTRNQSSYHRTTVASNRCTIPHAPA